MTHSSPSSQSILAADDLHQSLCSLSAAFERVCENNTAFFARTTSTNPQLRSLSIPTAEPVTNFHSLRIARVSFRRMALTLRENFWTTESVILSALIIMIRYCEATGFRPTLHSMHRMLAGAATVADKVHCDRCLTNAGCGRACGLNVLEINRLEETLLAGTNQRVLVQSAELQDTADLLRRINALVLTHDGQADRLLQVAVRLEGRRESNASPSGDGQYCASPQDSDEGETTASGRAAQQAASP